MKKLIISLIPFSYLILLLFQKDLSMLGDLGRHLKLGEIVVNCLCVPQSNLFSYTHPDFQIVNHEWLSEVIFYFTNQIFGLDGLLILKMAIIIISFSLIYSIALKKSSIFWVIIFSLLFIAIFSLRFFVLPELFSYLFISLFIFIFDIYRRSNKKYLLFIIPLLELLWVNMHIYFIVGIALYFFFVLDEFFKKRKIDKQILLIGILLLISTLINPSFIKGALLPLTVFHNYGFPVEENKSPFTILNPSSTNSNISYTLILQIFTFEILAGIFTFILFIKSQWQKRFFTQTSGLVALILGLKFTRCISLFGLLGLIPLSEFFTIYEKKLSSKIDTSMKSIIKGIIAIFVAIIISIHIKGLIDFNILNFGFVPSSENAVAFIKSADLKGNIFNNYVVGNYLIYGLYPENKVYIDARPEAYPASFFDDYWQMMADENFFNEQVKRYSINAVVFNVLYDDPTKIRPFLTRLLSSNEWFPVYADGTVTIIIRNNSVNEKIINKYKINTNN